MASVFDVASFIIDYYINNEEDSITNLQLNKLLYFAQGHYLARTETPLFDEKIEAWKYGPVVPSIYSIYKKYGKSPITKLDKHNSSINFKKEEMQVIIDVLREYGKYSPSALVNLTHKDGTPWSQVFIFGENSIISIEELKIFFQKKENRLNSFEEIINNIKSKTVKCFPREWYEPSEDPIWEEYM